MSSNPIYDAVVLAAAEGLNSIAERLYEMSQVEVPKSEEGRSTERFGRTLAESGRHPGNDPELAATPEKLIASVIYDNPYAAAQHEGSMTYHSRGGHLTHWKARSYTTPGTKRRYLADPLKAVMPGMPAAVGVEVEAALAITLASGDIIKVIP